MTNRKYTEKQIDEMIKELDHCVSVLTNDDDHFLSVLEDFYELTNKINKHFEDKKNIDKYTNDDTRDIAIRCVDSMFEHNLLDAKHFPSEYEMEIQDIIHNEINKALKIKESIDD